VVLGLPHFTVTEYLRDFFFGALEKLCADDCPVCGYPLELVGLRLREALDLPLYRGRCTQECCGTYVTFLPAFVAPGKWYGYASIQAALEFVARHGSSPSAGLTAWDGERDSRIIDKEPAGPSASTVRRWHGELGSGQGAETWLERAQEAVVPRQKGWPLVLPSYGPDGLVGETCGPLSASSPACPGSPGPTRKRRRSCAGQRSRSPGELLLGTLLLLGELLLGNGSGKPDSLLGVGLWFLEGQFGHRCLARADLAGRLIPCLSPDLAETPWGRWIYSPADP